MSVFIHSYIFRTASTPSVLASPGSPPVEQVPVTLPKQTVELQAAVYRTFATNLIKVPKKQRKTLLEKIVSPQDLNKFRGTSTVAKDLQFDRRTVISLGKRHPSKKHLKFVTAKQNIISFLTRPDHSITLPGKKDTVTIRKVKHQRVQLTEYLHILHKKYNSEFPSEKVGFTYFSAVRRQHKYILPVKCNNTNVCL